MAFPSIGIAAQTQIIPVSAHPGGCCPACGDAAGAPAPLAQIWCLSQGLPWERDLGQGLSHAAQRVNGQRHLYVRTQAQSGLFIYIYVNLLRARDSRALPGQMRVCDGHRLAKQLLTF